MTDATAKTKISIFEFANKVSAIWNSTHSTEWNSLAAGFIKARVWQKDGELRVYLGDAGFVNFTQTSEGCGINFVGLKYGVKSLIVPLLKALCDLYKVAGIGKTPVKMQEDEDGIIAPEGQHESGVHIVREWVEYH